MAWEIVGYDSTAEIYRGVVSGRYGERGVRQILQRLASRHLEPYEIVEAYTGARGTLDVQRYSDGTLNCGSNPHYMAHWVRV